MGGAVARALRSSDAARAVRDAEGQVRRLLDGHEEPHRGLRRSTTTRRSRALAALLVDDVPHRGGHPAAAACRARRSRTASPPCSSRSRLDDPVDARRAVDVEARHRQGDLAALRAAVDEVRRRHGATRGRRRRGARRATGSSSSRDDARTHGAREDEDDSSDATRARGQRTVTSVPIGVYGQTTCAFAKGISTQPRLCGQP